MRRKASSSASIDSFSLSSLAAAASNAVVSSSASGAGEPSAGNSSRITELQKPASNSSRI